MVALFVADIERDKTAQANLFQKQVKKIDAAEVREAIGIEFYLYFFRAVGHAIKPYIMYGFIATLK